VGEAMFMTFRSFGPRIGSRLRMITLQKWWSGAGSNRRPSAFQADARTN
jgi:hypothetical protein